MFSLLCTERTENNESILAYLLKPPVRIFLFLSWNKRYDKLIFLFEKSILFQIYFRL